MGSVKPEDSHNILCQQLVAQFFRAAASEGKGVNTGFRKVRLAVQTLSSTKFRG